MKVSECLFQVKEIFKKIISTSGIDELLVEFSLHKEELTRLCDFLLSSEQMKPCLEAHAKLKLDLKGNGDKKEAFLHSWTQMIIKTKLAKNLEEFYFILMVWAPIIVDFYLDYEKYINDCETKS